MGEPIVAFGVAAHWRQVWHETFHAEEIVGDRIYQPIIVTHSVLAESRILRARGMSDSARPWWRKAYDLSVMGRVGTEDTEFCRVFVPLRNFSLIVVPNYLSVFKLKVYIPWWHVDMTVDVEEYTGPIDDTTEALLRARFAELRTDLLRVEEKVDEIRQRLSSG